MAEADKAFLGAVLIKDLSNGDQPQYTLVRLQESGVSRGRIIKYTRGKEILDLKHQKASMSGQRMHCGKAKKGLLRELEALRKERDKAQTYLDVVGVILIVIDANQQITLINKKGCEILGYKEEKIIGKNWFDIFLRRSEQR